MNPQHSIAPKLMHYLAVLAFVICLSATQAIAEDAPSRVSIPLPDGEKIEFAAVYLGIDGERMFASRQIQLGSRDSSDSYKEQLVETLLSGGFVGRRNNKSDWLYYLGETEIQQRQWNAVMRWADKQESRTPRKANLSTKPITKVTIAEIYRFIEVLNTWMQTKQKGSLPKYKRSPAFARLPTEAEWAFAARGGIVTLERDRNIFDSPYPYTNLSQHEWYRQNTRELRSAGEKAPNPIGLRDMLGNVQELTLSLFGPEYQHGRFGSYVVRGGHYKSAPKDVYVSRRTEYASHKSNGEIRRPSDIGFRLALNTAISMVGVSSDTMSDEFDQYMDSRSLTRPGLAGSSSPAAQAEEDTINKFQDHISGLTTDNSKLKSQINRFEQDIDTAKEKATQAERQLREVQYRYKSLEREVVTLKQKTSKKRLQQLQNHISSLERQLREFTEGATPSRKSSEGLAGNKGVIQVSMLEERVMQLDKANTNLTNQSFRLEQDLHEARQINRDSNEKIHSLMGRLESKKHENADLERSRNGFIHEISKHEGRVRTIEKRYLEALMRQASANAYLGYHFMEEIAAITISLNNLSRSTRKNERIKRRANKMLQQATDMMHDYWNLVIQISDNTESSLFPIVKAELKEWFYKHKAGAHKDQQAKSLDLIERHLSIVRAGNRLRPDDLIPTLTQQPEWK